MCAGGVQFNAGVSQVLESAAAGARTMGRRWGRQRERGDGESAQAADERSMGHRFEPVALFKLSFRQAAGEKS